MSKIDLELIEQFLAGKGKRYAPCVKTVVNFFNEHEISEPTNEDYLKLSAYLQEQKKSGGGEKYSEYTIKKYLGVCKNFYKWIAAGCPQFENKTQEPNNQIQEQEQQLTLPTVENEKLYGKGRPKKQMETAKFSLYLPQELFKDIEDLADYEDKAVTVMIADLLYDSLKNYEDDLEFLREQRKQREARRARKQAL